MSKSDDLKAGLLNSINPAKAMLAGAKEEPIKEEPKKAEPKAEAVAELKAEPAKDDSKPKKERKEVRLNLVCYPSVKENLDAFTKTYEALGVSSNDLINRILQKTFEEKTLKEILMQYYLDDLQ